jgi:dipeptidyl aminopeptidase/acylaminoacyl peptidase
VTVRQFALVAAAAIFCGGAGADTIRSPSSRWVGWSDGVAAWTPDGTQLLIQRAYSPPKGPGDYRFALIGADGSRFRALSRPRSIFEVWDMSASFSPDGKQLLVSRELGLTEEVVYVKDVATGSERRLTPPHVSEIRGNWSPDGSRVIVVRISGQSQDVWTPYSERPDGGDARQLAPPGHILYADYLPNGKVVLTRFNESLKSTVEIVPGRTLTPVGNWLVLDWTRDSKRLLLLRNADEANESLWLVNIDGSELRRLGPGEEGSFSPDGTQVAYTPPRFGRDHGIYVIGVDGGDRRRLAARGSGPDWSPDGKTIAYDDEGPCGEAGIYLVGVDGDGAHRLTNDCRIVGTRRNDLLLGTSERDVILGRGGDDTINANPGDRPPAYYGVWDYDYVDGGPGNDTIYGGRGVDVLRGGAGNDRIYGGRGADWIYGGPGADLLDGGPYNDRIFAADGTRDVIRCGSGKDRVVADRFDVVAADCERVTRR